MAKVETTKLASKREHRLKFGMGGHLSHFLDLREPAEADADYLFHVSNSHAKVASKFVTDNMEHVLTAQFGTNVEDGSERLVAREAVVDICDGDLAYFGSERLSVFSPPSRERALNSIKYYALIGYQRFRRKLPSKSSVMDRFLNLRDIKANAHQIGAHTCWNHTVPYGTALLGWYCPRHFVAGYDRTVPPGHFPSGFS